jgi:hypothetical protein
MSTNTMNTTTSKKTDDVQVMEARINLMTMPPEDVLPNIAHVAWMSALIAADKLAPGSRWLSSVDILLHKRTNLRACAAQIIGYGQPCRVLTGLLNPHGTTKLVKVVFASHKEILDEVKEVPV